MRLKSLSELKRRELREIPLATLPRTVLMTPYAREKAFRIGELVRSVHGESLEWYGFTLGSADRPDLITDIGLPRNDLNLQTYASLSPERIAEFQESLHKDTVVNGWIHSHGALAVKHFSHTDDRNHGVVLDYVAASLKKPVAKREVAIRDCVFLLKGHFVDEDLSRGSVCIITDAPIAEATIMETIYGSFCYAIVVGDEGWHEQEIHTREYGVLSGYSRMSHQAAEITMVDTGRTLNELEIGHLREEVEKKIRPNKNPPLELMERM
ncbi:MAG: hypothetical protein HGB17_06745 [Syntrophobacteraceae bacterium]|nr:hypothetical protein [Syntrophobacteraceae bacterium]